MKVDMVMPQMGESIAEGTILKWLKREGDRVERDENILEISTDKVDSEIPAPAAGTIVALLAAEGETVPVGNVIARIETGAAAAETGAAAPATGTTGGEEPIASAASRPAPPPPSEAAAAPATGRPVEGIPARDRAGRFYSPLVRSIARAEGVSLEELSRIAGTGRGGRVSKDDLLAYLARRGGASAIGVEAAETRLTNDGPIAVVPMDHIRRRIAEHMVRSKATSPHVASVTEADMTRIVRHRDAVKESFARSAGFKLTYTPFFIQAVAGALKVFPFVNASIEGTKILVKRFVNIGIAVDVDYGLIVPVIRGADSLNFLGIARAVHDLATRARSKELKPDEVTGGTFSITNMGAVGNLFGVPIISQPQVAILGVGAIEKRPVVRDDAIVIREMVYLCLSYDHRLVDGAMGGAFLEQVARNLETMELE